MKSWGWAIVFSLHLGSLNKPTVPGAGQKVCGAMVGGGGGTYSSVQLSSSRTILWYMFE